MYGLACDNVKNFEVVLANSTVIEANAASNPELFFALKGGGPNYGKLDLPSAANDSIDTISQESLPALTCTRCRFTKSGTSLISITSLIIRTFLRQLYKLRTLWRATVRLVSYSMQIKAQFTSASSMGNGAKNQLSTQSIQAESSHEKQTGQSFP